ncbi:MAG TPA: nuclear transport factor 2 family protein [Gemmatimonadales bacterium]|nr:nuclear transport factor 2 family protein [Gemmatimonadales bacterium]
MANQDNTLSVQQGYAAFARGDVQAVLDMMVDDVVWISPGPRNLLPTAGERRGRAQVAEFFATLNEVEKIQLFDPHEFVAQGDKVVAFVTYRSRVRATGQTIETELAHVFTIRNGKIAEFREFFDTAAAVAAFQAPAMAGH